MGSAKKVVHFLVLQHLDQKVVPKKGSAKKVVHFLVLQYPDTFWFCNILKVQRCPALYFLVHYTAKTVWEVPKKLYKLFYCFFFMFLVDERINRRGQQPSLPFGYATERSTKIGWQTSVMHEKHYVEVVKHYLLE